jgi:hypothetical protein
MPGGYGSHTDYMGWVKEDAKLRQQIIEDTLKKAFSKFIEKREVGVIVFSNISAFELADAIVAHPIVLKPLLAVCNIAARAIERDLSIKNVDTYSPSLNDEQARVIAGYIKPFLPPVIEIPALCQIDRVAFVDKEIRKKKGQWEKKVIESLNQFSTVKFQKRIFEAEGEQFELDAATPNIGSVNIGIDIKRIEARRDIHKRCDEIVNKAIKLKTAFPNARFGAVIYYPFLDEHVNIQNRLRSDQINCVVFASEAEESIKNAVRMLLSGLGVSAE